MQPAHDRLFHFTFRQTMHAVSWLQKVLPAAITEAIDWSSLTAANQRFPGLRARDMTPLATLTLLCLRFVRTFEPHELLAAIDRWGDLLRSIEADPTQPAGDAIDAIGWYLLDASELAPEDLQMAFSKNLNQPQSAIMTTAQRIHSEALTAGHTAGLVAGQARLLLRQLERRFGTLPADLTARVRSATPTEIDRWGDRILDASDLAAVFAN